MKFKKHGNNEYALFGGYWVRNFTKNIRPVDINHIVPRSDYQLLIENDMALRSLNIPEIGSEELRYDRCLIVSDGYRFNEYKQHLVSIPKDVCVIGVNRSLSKWQQGTELLKRQMNFFLVNNPYPDCMSCFPKHRYFPPCVASTRTYSGFVQEYQGKGTLFKYVPVFDETFKSEEGNYFQIDDYRNPVCASIGLAYRFGAKKVGLFCCDDAFEQERPAAEQMANKLWAYPQHRISHSLIEGNLYWLQKAGIEVKDFSNGYGYGSIETLQPSEIAKFWET